MVRSRGALALILALCLCASACGGMRQPPPPGEESPGSSLSPSSAAAFTTREEPPERPAPPSEESLPAGPAESEAPEGSSPPAEGPSAPDAPAPEAPGREGTPGASSGPPEESETPPTGSRPDSPSSAPAEDPTSLPEGESSPPESQPEETEQQPGEGEPDPAQPPQPEKEPPPKGDPQGSRWMNIHEATLLTLINKERVRRGVPPLTQDPELTAAARLRAAELFSGNYVSHTRPDGAPWETVLQRDVPVAFALAAENLAWTNHAVGKDIPAFQWFQMWQESESHYAAMVDDHYTHCGVAILAGPYFDGEEQSYAVALFCSY